MNCCNMLCSVAKELDNIALFPHLTAAVRVQNKKTGEVTGPKSVSFSFATTLLRGMLAVMALLLILKSILCLCRWKREKKIRKKYRKKAKGMRLFPRTSGMMKKKK